MGQNSFLIAGSYYVNERLGLLDARGLVAGDGREGGLTKLN